MADRIADSTPSLTFDANIVALDLGSLQAKTNKVTIDLNRSRKKLYAHLCAVYMWWRRAKKIHGYLDSEYRKLSRKFRTVAVEPNFIKLIWLVWGEDSDLTNQYADRYSRALKAVHAEYEKHPQLYDKDGEAKLVNFIHRSGGLSKIAGYVHPDDKIPGGGKKGSGVKSGTPDGRDLNARIGHDAEFYVNSVGPSVLEFPSTVARDKDKYTLSLENQWSEKLNVDSGFKGLSLIETVLSDYYLHQLDASDTSIRPLLELIQTQCYPPHLQKFSRRYDQKLSAKKGKNDNIGFGRRVAYLCQSKQLLLSPTGGSSGIISSVTPNLPLLDNCSVDLFLPIEQRQTIEKELLQCRKFNLYGSSHSQNFDVCSDDAFSSRSVELIHIADESDRMEIELQPLTYCDAELTTQLVLRDEFVLNPIWSAEVPFSWFQKLSKQFLAPWLDGHGNHMSRRSHVLLSVLFDSSELDINFYRRSGRFELSEQVSLDTNSDVYARARAMFRAQDWAITLRGISLLPVCGDVSLVVSNDLMKISFTTKGADGSFHEIFIPTVDAAGKHSKHVFSEYLPICKQGESENFRNQSTDDASDLGKVA